VLPVSAGVGEGSSTLSDDAIDLVEVPTRRHRWLVAVVALVTASYLVWLVVAHWSQIDRAVVRLQGAGTRWLLAAIALELFSQACSVTVQHRLLRRAGSRFGIFATARLVLAQNAIILALPGGQAVASVFSYRQIRHRGANSSAAIWVVAASNLITMLALATFGAFTATGASWITIVSGSFLVVALAVLVTLARAPQRLHRPAVALVRVADRLRPHRVGGQNAHQRVEQRLARLSTVQLGWRDWLVVATFALVAVAADCAVWICASHAIIVRSARCVRSPLSGRAAQQCAAFRAPTTAALLVAYSAGQAALQLPFLPGGIGLVESFMTAALTTSKVRAIQALSAVLLYRAISFWGIVVIGGAMWLALRRTRRHAPIADERVTTAIDEPDVV